MIYKKWFTLLTTCTLLVLFSCNDMSNSESMTPIATVIEVPDWARNANIYEMNIRQYTPEGTFNAIVPHLDRLKNMGVDIIWLMPIHPISKTKRKGTLGSYYAVNGFRDINPEYGDLNDFQNFLREIHNREMRLLIDWVPHHTGWDHPWITEHPDWFSQDSAGNIIDPINEETGEPWGWTDVAELSLGNREMREEIIADMIYWLDMGVDGFRVDHAHGLPADYWTQVRHALAQRGKPIFMLAEGEHDYLRNDSTFIAGYAWAFHHAMNDIAKGEKTVNYLDTLLSTDRHEYDYGYNMYFTTNHDENSWAGTVMERMGEGHKTFAVLTHTVDGMPLIYAGQEAPTTKRLEFFEKDDIDWKDYGYADFYQTLNALKHRNKALWNGTDGGLSERINISDNVYAFSRNKDSDSVIVVLNLSASNQSTELAVAIEGLVDVFTGTEHNIPSGTSIELGPWEYLVLSSN